MVPLNDVELLALVVVSGDKRTSGIEREGERRTVGSDIYDIICQGSVCKQCHGLKLKNCLNRPTSLLSWRLSVQVALGGPPSDFEPILNEPALSLSSCVTGTEPESRVTVKVLSEVSCCFVCACKHAIPLL